MNKADASGQDAQDARRFLTFRVQGRLYALPAETVAEVIRIPAFARVPHAPMALLGLANLRGVVLPLASVRGLLGLDRVEDGLESRAIVLDKDAPVAMAVDSVETLMTVAADRLEVASSQLGERAGERLTGAFSLPNGDVARILDIDALFDAAFAGRTLPDRRTALRSTSEPTNRDVERPLARDALVTFEVAEQEFGLDLAMVEEIVPVPDGIAMVPHAEAPVVGMMAFRERVLPLLSLRGLLGFPPAAEGTNHREKILVVRVRGTLVGLIADRTRAVISAEHTRLDPLPAVIAARTRGEARVRAVYRGDDGRRLISILAPEQLFREDVMQRVGHGLVAEDRQLQEDESGSTRAFVVFRLGGSEFGLPVEAVAEVARVPEHITRVPRTPKFLEGVVNLRGDVLPVVDQRRRFDMAAVELAEGRRLVVVRTARHRAGLIVDGISSVLRTAADSIGPAPELTGDISRLVTGVVSLERGDRIVLLLDPDELLTRAERGLLDAFERKARASS